MRESCSIRNPKSAIRDGALLALALVLGVAGCERDHIEVTVEPRPDGSFVRTIRLWHTDTEKKGQVLAPPAALVDQAKPQYPKRLETQDATVAFQGEFRMVPPDLRRGDETNRGEYTLWTSRLGQLGYYRERRPGRLDHFARLREAADAADLLIRLAATIARQQLQGEKGLDELLKCIEGPFRNDIKEALFFLTHANLGASAGFAGDEAERTLVAAAAFLVQFAEERGYLEAADLPKLLTKEGAISVGTALVAKRMGRPLDAPLRKKLAALAEPEAAQGAYAAALQELKLTDKQFEDAIKPLMPRIELGGGGPELRYTLVVPQGAEVRYTSGRQDPKTNAIHWVDALDDRPVAGLYYALWTAPDEAWQKEHLGRVVLRGKDLGDYVLWENSLRPELAAAWRAALDRLDPKGDLAQQLAAIRLTPAAKDGQPEEGANLIIEALKPKKQ